jgi:ATP-dependent RNA circularization protein (DNA/RNA ligase family)
MNEFIKFPRTPHLFILPGLDIRNDKILSETEAEVFYTSPIIVEEKVDGANIGFSFDQNGELRIQNRGNYLSLGAHDQFRPLWDWSYLKIDLFQSILSERYILFGEWCYAKHSVHYTLLPDWFLGFDIYDKTRGFFLPTKIRNEFFQSLNIFSVPQVGAGRYKKKQLIDLVQSEKSKVGEGNLEGVYLRFESKTQLIKRAKIVRADFIQDIGQHWSKGPMVLNKLLTEKNSS